MFPAPESISLSYKDKLIFCPTGSDNLWRVEWHHGERGRPYSLVEAPSGGFFHTHQEVGVRMHEIEQSMMRMPIRAAEQAWRELDRLTLYLCAHGARHLPLRRRRRGASRFVIGAGPS